MLILTSSYVFASANLSLTASLENDNIWMGETVQLTLFLNGSEEAIAPELDIPGVEVKPIGGTIRSSRSVTSINGKVTENISKAYVYGYQLTPMTTGLINIPSIEAVVEGQTLRTEPIALNVRQPEFSDDYLLELEFDRDRVYVDEDCSLKISFFYAKSLRSLEIRVPGIENFSQKHFSVPPGKDRYEINLNGSLVVFSGVDRGDMAGLTATVTIKPESAGRISLQNSSASFDAVTGYQRVQDFFGRIQNQEVYGRMVVPGQEASVEVLPFPEAGKPADFFGLSGAITLDLDIDRTEVHIGDPLTLKLEVGGMNNTDVAIPPLAEYLGEGIDIPDTRSTAKVEGRTRTVTQTIRIKDPGVTEIPAVTFCYYNTESESYEYAASGAIPIKVLDTKIVTSAELEGDSQGDTGPEKVMLEPKRDGLYYNYSGRELLRRDEIQAVRYTESVLVKILLFFPPVFFLISWLITTLLPQIRSRAAEHADRRKALVKLKRAFRKRDFRDTRAVIADFNRSLAEFLKKHGRAGDENLVKEHMEEINALLYGRAEMTEEEASSAVKSILDLLEEGEASDA